MAEDKCIVLARVAERAERFDEMADFMKERVQTSKPLNLEERDMFSAAFKNALSERRHAVRIARGVADEEEAHGRIPNKDLALGYKSKVETELHNICQKALELLESVLVPSAADAEGRTFYLKMQGDYYRYDAEFAQGPAHDQSKEKANQAYNAGMEVAKAIPAAHPYHLGLALNYSVFQHEVLKETDNAKNTAKQAIANAQAQLQSCPSESLDDAILTIQLLQDNLALWTQ